MNHTNLVLIAVFTLILAVTTPLQTFNLVSAASVQPPALIIEGVHNDDVYIGSVLLIIEAHVPTGAPAVVAISFSMDEQPFNSPMPPGHKTSDPPNVHDIYYVRIEMSKPMDGNHTIKVYSKDASGKEMSNSVHFAVDSNRPIPTETPEPTAQTNNFFNTQNSVLLIVGIVIVVSLLGIVLLFKTKRARKSTPLSRDSNNSVLY